MIVSRRTPIGTRRTYFRRPGYRRGLGAVDPSSVYSTDCGPGLILDPGPPPHCIEQQYADKLSQMIAYESPNAPGCYIQDLSRNACFDVLGNVVGCNEQPECDAVTGARHVQYPLPGGPTNVGLPIQTGGLPPTSGPIFAPNLAAKLPSDFVATPFVPQTAAQVQAAISAALGPDQGKAFAAASGQAPSTPASSGGVAAQSNAAPTVPFAGVTAQSNAPSPSVASPPASDGDFQNVLGFPVPTKIVSGKIFGIPDWILLIGGLGIGGAFLVGRSR